MSLGHSNSQETPRKGAPPKAAWGQQVDRNIKNLFRRLPPRQSAPHYRSARFTPSSADGKLYFGKGTVTSYLFETGTGKQTPRYPTIGGITIDTSPAPFFDLAEYAPGKDYIAVIRVKQWTNSAIELYEADESIADDDEVLLVIATFTLDGEGRIENLQHTFTSDIVLPVPTYIEDSDSSSSGSDSDSASGGSGGSGSSSSASSSYDPTPNCDFEYPDPTWGWCTTNPTEVACPPPPLTRQSPVRCIEWETLVPSEYRGVGCANFWLKISITGGYEMVANNPDDDNAARNNPVADYALIELTGTTLSDIGSCEFAQRIFTPCTDHQVIFEVFSEHDPGSGSVPESAHPCCGLLYRGTFNFTNPPCTGTSCTDAPP